MNNCQFLFFNQFQSGGWVPGDIDPEGSATGSHILDGDHSQGWQPCQLNKVPMKQGREAATWVTLITSVGKGEGINLLNRTSGPYL